MSLWPIVVAECSNYPCGERRSIFDYGLDFDDDQQLFLDALVADGWYVTFRAEEIEADDDGFIDPYCPKCVEVGKMWTRRDPAYCGEGVKMMSVQPTGRGSSYSWMLFEQGISAERVRERIAELEQEQLAAAQEKAALLSGLFGVIQRIDEVLEDDGSAGERKKGKRTM